MQYIHQDRCGVRFTLTGPISAMFNSLPPQATRYNYTSDKKYALVEVSHVALSVRRTTYNYIHMYVG